MWPKILIILTMFGSVISELTVGGIDRTMSPSVKSLGYKIVYGDDDLDDINEVVKEKEKMEMFKHKVKSNEQVSPLPRQDVKCLMSTDNHCTKNMYEIKGVLIKAMKNNCAKCTEGEKKKAGKVVASLMAHDPVAWKMFLTRYAVVTKLDIKHEDSFLEPNEVMYKIIGPPQEIIESKTRFMSPGTTVTVKKFSLEQI